MNAWPIRIHENRPDRSLKASIADLLDALLQARQARDAARLAIRQAERRIEALRGENARLRGIIDMQTTTRNANGNKKPHTLAIDRMGTPYPRAS